ncbi:MAG: nitronate monooxygenase [Pseudomonadota bacterium]
MVDACDLLSLERPVLQAAMGGVSRRELVVAVSEAGGLGTLGYLPPDAFAAELRAIDERLAGRAYAANLLLPIVTRAHISACLAAPVPIVTLFFGFDQPLLTALKEAGKIVLFQVGDETEAARAIAGGADGLIAQGFEAGGHLRGETPLATLLPKLRARFPDHPIIGAGGVHDAASAAACRALGADAVCAGTRFLASPEAAAHDAYKTALIEADGTVVTQLFGVGWRDPHRVIPNAATKRWCSAEGREPRYLKPLHAAARAASRLAANDGGAAMARRQSLRFPVYTPVTLTPEMPAHLKEAVALYAGVCVKDVTSVKPAPEIVSDLAP